MLAHVVHKGFAVYGQVAELPLQVSMVQALLSSVHAVPEEAKPSVGQDTLEPLQVSATSQPPAAALRHVNPDGRNTSAGQELELPLHVSATSHRLLPAERHTVPLVARISAGQLPEEPLQFSATSQPPDAARH